jgi:class 3 adenylate cyclase
MTAFRLTAIMKTDISGSTPRFRALHEADLAALLAQHREFVVRISARQEGQIVKSGGDGFWIAFPSVTAAGLAARAMQEELRRSQSNKGDDRLAMRIVITAGDVIYQDGDFFGDAVALAARIETVTPPDEIYLSAAASQAINQAEVRTTLVGPFTLKGFAEPVAVYRIEQTHRAQIIKDQYIVFTDLSGFRKFAQAATMATIEVVLDRLLELIEQVCRSFDGVNRFNVADAYCLTFPDADRALEAAERIAQEWNPYERKQHFGCPIFVAIHRGTLYLFRSYLLGDDVDLAASVVTAAQRLSETDASVFVTAAVQRELAESPWHPRLRPIDLGHGPRGRLAGIEVYCLTGSSRRN